jgi:hypothetical protein
VPAPILAERAFGGAFGRSAACGARVGAAESFVSFIPLFDGMACGTLDGVVATAWAPVPIGI